MYGLSPKDHTATLTKTKISLILIQDGEGIGLFAVVKIVAR